ncbi:hypothetical protein [Butyrivibrio sp. MC2013]|uniref:hypothetical protein n=1 Tax=Butyrivibrio sp. MC2013 TaxID=1280686 RepID=UPI0003F5645A|nr:hypothetical protein [Butyrivibrio sp. MC2013]
MSNLMIILIAAAVFLALIIWFTVDTRHVKKWTGISFLIAIGGGLIIYGSIDADQFRDMPVIAVLRTVVHVGRMFGNAGDGAHDSFVGVVGDNIFTSVFYWLVHFFAYYSVVSALVLAIGKDIVRGFRTWLLRFRDIELIYGIDDNTIGLGASLIAGRRVSLVFVGKGQISDSFVSRTGALVYDDPDAMGATPAFLKRLSVRAGTGRIRVSAISDDDEANYSYAAGMLGSLEETGIASDNTELVLFARSAMLGAELQAAPDHYGYGDVRVYKREELSARLLTRSYPLSDTVAFDDKGRALGDVDILMVGFGNIGQEILRRLVASGQFEGSSFHVRIFDPACERTDGFFRSRYPGLINAYDIEFEAADGRSRKLTEYIRQHADSLSLITVAVGSPDLSRDISYGIIDVLESCGADLPVYQCYSDRIVRNHRRDICVTTGVYDKDIIYGNHLDALAKEINHYYYGEGSVDEQWKSCDYFSRMSCSASADYLSCLFKRLGLDSNSLGSIDGELMENLAKSEHLRWMAFHYSMGYQAMSNEERQERAERYKEDHSVRICKDTVNKRHACLIPWDELDALSEYENALTGKNIDYKQMDRENIKAVAAIISRMME